MPMLLPIHIAAGGLAIVLGAVVLFVKKGGTIHRGESMEVSLRSHRLSHRMRVRDSGGLP